MSAINDLLKVIHDESFSQEIFDMGEQAAAELAAMQEQNKKMIEFLKKARNDEFCDNDGRGCGTGSRADDLLEEMGIE